MQDPPQRVMSSLLLYKYQKNKGVSLIRLSKPKPKSRTQSQAASAATLFPTHLIRPGPHTYIGRYRVGDEKVVE